MFRLKQLIAYLRGTICAIRGEHKFWPQNIPGVGAVSCCTTCGMYRIQHIRDLRK